MTKTLEVGVSLFRRQYGFRKFSLLLVNSILLAEGVFYVSNGINRIRKKELLGIG